MIRRKSPATLRTAPELFEHGLIAPDELGKIEQVAAQFSVAITPSVLATIKDADPHGAVARQYVPSAAENATSAAELDDPIGDAAHAPVRGIIHRYADRVLLNVLSNCAVYCRYCFRRETVGAGSKALSDDELDAAIGYIAGNRAIWEVILSGGDPLMLPAARLAAIAGRIAKIGHVGVLRVHSRVPLAAPERITDAVIAALKIVQPTWLVLHVNHADELTGEVRSTLARLADAGIPLLSQSVLLRGINDDAATLTRLYRELVMLRVKPYYLHHADKARGTAHFRTTLEEGQAIVAEMRGDVSGLCQPTYVLDIPGGHGKVPIGPGYISRCGDGLEVEDIRGVKHCYRDD